MRHPLLFGGDFVLTTPELIEVVDFKAWRKVSNTKEYRRRRRFSPYLTLKTGDTLLKLVGYTAVWDFLDAIQPQLPRIPINSVMKGYEFYDEETMSFLEEVAWFVIESKTPFIGFRVDENGLAKVVAKPISNIPVNSKTYIGLAELTLHDAGTYYVAMLETNQRNNRMYFCYTMGLGIRPFLGKLYTNVDDAQRYVVATVEKLKEQKDVGESLIIRNNMFDEEIDLLENESFFLLLQQKENQIKG
tara:strand:- start:8172 stop:8906 length:735 start_codon:yes stop_codon:yes gene_type:complete